MHHNNIMSDFSAEQNIKKSYNYLKNTSKFSKRSHQKKNYIEKKEAERERKKMFKLIRCKMNERTISKGQDYNYV